MSCTLNAPAWSPTWRPDFRPGASAAVVIPTPKAEITRAETPHAIIVRMRFSSTMSRPTPRTQLSRSGLPCQSVVEPGSSDDSAVGQRLEEFDEVVELPGLQ